MKTSTPFTCRVSETNTIGFKAEVQTQNLSIQSKYANHYTLCDPEHYITKWPITVAAQSKALTVFASSNTGVLSWNPTREMNVCVWLFYLCCPVYRQRPSDGLFSVQRRPTDCVKDQETEKAAKDQQKDCRAINNNNNNNNITKWNGTVAMKIIQIRMWKVTPDGRLTRVVFNLFCSRTPDVISLQLCNHNAVGV
jgi:hypothetical protein